LGSFSRDSAHPDIVKVKENYLEKRIQGEGSVLMLEAIDWGHKMLEKEKRSAVRRNFTDVIKEEHFPPCVQLIGQGLEDGRKRSVFVLASFLRRMNWKWEDIEAYMEKWNSSNKSPLPDNYLRSQLRWHRQQKREILPPACSRDGWYPSFGVCKPDGICGPQKSIKNPVNYPMRKLSIGKSRGKGSKGKSKYKSKGRRSSR
jgi:DNA primase large subunit